MPISKTLLKILVCPETKQALSLADAKLLSDVNEKIKMGNVKNRAGEVIKQTIQEALVREDKKVLYMINTSIPVLLIEKAVYL